MTTNCPVCRMDVGGMFADGIFFRCGTHIGAEGWKHSDACQRIREQNDQLSAKKALEVREAFQIVANETGLTFERDKDADCIVYDAQYEVGGVVFRKNSIPGDGPLLIGPQT